MSRSRAQLSWATLSAIVTGGAACEYCGAEEDLVAHHKIPRRYGGLDLLSNLEPVCRSCHPGVEQEAISRAKLIRERPERPQSPRAGGRRPRLPRPY